MKLFNTSELEQTNNTNFSRDHPDNEMPAAQRRRNYYLTWNDAALIRRAGERIYRQPGEGYYIVRPRRRTLDNFFK